MKYIKYIIAGLINVALIMIIVSTFFMNTDFGIPAMLMFFCIFALLIYNLSLKVVSNMLANYDKSMGKEVISILFSLWPILLPVLAMLLYKLGSYTNS